MTDSTQDNQPMIHDLTVQKTGKTLHLTIPRSMQIKWRLNKGSRLFLIEGNDHYRLVSVNPNADWF